MRPSCSWKIGSGHDQFPSVVSSIKIRCIGPISQEFSQFAPRRQTSRYQPIRFSLTLLLVRALPAFSHEFVPSSTSICYSPIEASRPKEHVSDKRTTRPRGMLTSAVTAKRKVVTYRKQASRMASFGAVRYDREPLSNPYQTHDLCPVDLCPCRPPYGSAALSRWQICVSG